jgi:2-polyprenyl-6-methoxyphenol hydroxylase-like FAD-dependent oxidoreductase
MMLRGLQTSPRVRIHHGRELVALDLHDDHVALEFGQTGDPTDRVQAKARYVIGADGARSTVRELLAIRPIDLGFVYDWLVVDVLPHQKREWKPYVIQYCDPARPTTLVGSGPGRRRWEFMRLPGETVEELNTAETAWKLLAKWDIAPSNATLERHAVYTFRGSWADQWKKGRVFLAGDAAHLMPPFLGQGLCAGMRDALAVSWRLAAVMRDGASEALLESYGPERREHVVEIIRQAVEIGRLICMVDPAAVAARNAQMKAAMKDPRLGLKPPPEPRLGYAGAYQIDDKNAGYLSVQGPVRCRGREGLFDDVVGQGWQLLLRSGDGPCVLDASARESLRRIGAVVADFGPAGDTTDLDGVYGRWFDRLGVQAVLVRPDLYVYGSGSLAQVGDLLNSAQSMLGLAAREPARIAQRG